MTKCIGNGLLQNGYSCWFNAAFNGFILSSGSASIVLNRISKYMKKQKLEHIDIYNIETCAANKHDEVKLLFNIVYTFFCTPQKDHSRSIALILRKSLKLQHYVYPLPIPGNWPHETFMKLCSVFKITYEIVNKEFLNMVSTSGYFVSQRKKPPQLLWFNNISSSVKQLPIDITIQCNGKDVVYTIDNAVIHQSSLTNLVLHYFTAYRCKDMYYMFNSENGMHYPGQWTTSSYFSKKERYVYSYAVYIQKDITFKTSDPKNICKIRNSNSASSMTSASSFMKSSESTPSPQPTSCLTLNSKTSRCKKIHPISKH